MKILIMRLKLIFKTLKVQMINYKQLIMIKIQNNNSSLLNNKKIN